MSSGCSKKLKKSKTNWGKTFDYLYNPLLLLGQILMEKKTSNCQAVFAGTKRKKSRMMTVEESRNELTQNGREDVG